MCVPACVCVSLLLFLLFRVGTQSKLDATFFAVLDSVVHREPRLMVLVVTLTL